MKMLGDAFQPKIALRIAKKRAEISEIEKNRKKEPTIDDYLECDQVLLDFGICVVNIPEFRTYSDLERWQHDTIRQSFRSRRKGAR